MQNTPRSSVFSTPRRAAPVPSGAMRLLLPPSRRCNDRSEARVQLDGCALSRRSRSAGSHRLYAEFGENLIIFHFSDMKKKRT